MDAVIKRISELDAAGSGATVVLLQSGATPSRIGQILARSFRVVRYAVAEVDAEQAGAAAAELAAVIAARGPDPVGVIADAASLSAALALVTARPELVRALALLAPPIPDQAPAEIKTPVLALFGTRAMPAQVGRRMRAAIANCNVVLVYDADKDLAIQRPEAVAAVLHEFMSAGDRFLVTGKSGKLYP
jgi:pimeloyl-ACP methyl ester carboxylesterase